MPAEEVDIVLDRRLMRRLGLVERALAIDR
jgi:hypothetical protein